MGTMTALMGRAGMKERPQGFVTIAARLGCRGDQVQPPCDVGRDVGISSHGSGHKTVFRRTERHGYIRAKRAAPNGNGMGADFLVINQNSVLTLKGPLKVEVIDLTEY